MREYSTTYLKYQLIGEFHIKTEWFVIQSSDSTQQRCYIALFVNRRPAGFFFY